MNKNILKKELNEIEAEFCDYFNLKKIKSCFKNKYEIDTKYGKYHFYISDYSIFGKFQDVSKLKILPPQVQYCNGELYEMVYYPNIFSGKFNFHFEGVHDFIDTLSRITD